MTLVERTAVRKSIPNLRIVPVGGFLIRNMSKLHSFEDITHLKFGLVDFYLVMNPKLIQEILVTKQRDFVKGRFLQRTKKVFGEGLLTSEGEYHHSQRRLIQPAFHNEKIGSYADVMISYTKEMVDMWGDGEILDIHSEMAKLTMRIVAKCLFGSDIQSGTKELSTDLTLMIDYFSRLSSPFSGVYEKLPGNKKYENALQRIDKMILELIDSRRKSGRTSNDLLSILLETRDQKGELMSPQRLRDEVLILFAAGHETTANALTWTWYLLSQNPKMEEHLHKEVDSVLADLLQNEIDAGRLGYTRKVLTESMRLYPPAWVLVRKAIHDVEIGPYTLPKDSNIVISQYVTHHDPKYFEDPETFIPERWTPEKTKAIPRFAYFPFGGGPRGCIGEPFAWMEGILLLAIISRKWSMKHVEGHRVEMLPRITLRPKYGMKMEVHARSL